MRGDEPGGIDDFYAAAMAIGRNTLRRLYRGICESSRMSGSEFDDAVETALQEAARVAWERWDTYDPLKSDRRAGNPGKGCVCRLLMR